MRHFLTLALVAVLFVPACGSKQGPPGAKRGTASGTSTAKTEDPEADEGQARRGGGGRPGEVAKEVPRKIRYTADVWVTVKNLSDAEQALMALLQKEKGYVAKSDVSGTTGEPRYGRWTLRVPVARFDAFREAVVKLGEPTRNSVDSEDVTEEFYDLQARIKNMQAEEAGVRKLYEKTTGKMEDVLAVRRELGDVRDKIDRAQGRLKLLANLTDMTTINVTLSERDAYVPEEAASFGTTAGRTLGDSAFALLQLGRALALVAVALLPWLPVLAALAVLGWFLIRRRRKLAEVQAVVPVPPPPPPA